MKTFSTAYNRPEGSSLDQKDQSSKTKQSEKDNCDINKIMERFNRTGQLPRLRTIEPIFGDVRTPDYQTAQQLIIDAKKAFMELPSKVRQYFGHDPQNYVKALTNPSEETKKALLKFGLMVESQPTTDDTLREIAKNTKPESKKPSGNSTPT